MNTNEHLSQSVNPRGPLPEPDAWREPGAVLLVSCYELGHQPMGIASVAGALCRAGFQPEAHDTSIEGLNSEKISRAAFIGMSVPMHTALRLGTRVAKEVRALNPHAHICFYGLYAHLNREYLLEHFADSVIAGEVEETLVELVARLSEGRDATVEGVSLRGVSAEPVLKRINFAQPDRSRLPGIVSYAYLELDKREVLVGHTEASRGCLHLCAHCPIPPVYGGRFFVVPQSVVIDDIRNLVSRGAEHITFGDPDFLNGPGHSLAIVRKMHEEFPHLTFDFTAKIEHILKHREIFPELKRLGGLFAVSAIESLSDEVLERLRKDHTRADAERALQIMRSAGITLRPSLVAFTPWTTLNDYLEVFEFVAREDLIDAVDPVQYTMRLLIPPGSLLLDEPELKPHLGALHPGSFTYEWKHPDPRMDELHARVTALVEASVAMNGDPALTFHTLWRLARQLRDGDATEQSLPPIAAERSRPPRLTEAWFC